MIPELLTKLAQEYLNNPEFTNSVRILIGVLVVLLMLWAMITWKLFRFWVKHR